MIIKNAKIYTMAGQIIENGYIEFTDKIKSLGDMRNCPEGEAFDAKGKRLYPGFIDAHCHLGIIEDSIADEGDDCNEMTDPVTPQLRAIDAINSLDNCFIDAKQAGVTTVLTGPGSSNPIAGQVAAIKTHGICIDDMIIKAPAAIKFALGENPKRIYSDKQASPSTRMAIAAIIRDELIKAREYAQKDPKTREYDSKLEALSLLFTKKIPAHVHAHRADDIFTAIRIFEEFGIDYCILHCTQGHLIAQRLGEKGVTVCAGPMIADRTKPELAHASLKNPAILSDSGVMTAIVTDHPELPIQYLPISAGLAVREGMDYEQALKAITINAAKICKLDDRIGSLEVGKDADMCLFDCDPITLMAKPKMVICDGEIAFEEAELCAR